jgi:hypothetical protein
MVVDIALGVCLGIVLAALVLRHWRQLIAGSLTIIAGALVIGFLIFLGTLVWSHFADIATIAGAFVALAVLYGVPFWVYGRVASAYPSFNALIKGDPPWNRPARVPARLLVMAVFAISVAALGIGALLGSVSLIDYIGNHAGNK